MLKFYSIAHTSKARDRKIDSKNSQRETARKECPVSRLRTRYTWGPCIGQRWSQNCPHSEAENHLQRRARGWRCRNDLAHYSIQVGRRNTQTTTKLVVFQRVPRSRAGSIGGSMSVSPNEAAENFALLDERSCRGRCWPGGGTRPSKLTGKVWQWEER